MEKVKVAPSMLAADPGALARDIARAEAAGADMLHIDVMDGHFVIPLSFGAATVAALRPKSGLFFDVHLMVTNPWHHIDDFIDAGADGVTIHVESGGNIGKMLKHIRARGCKAALSINPPTPWQAMLPYMDLMDMALVMSVHPGYGGQKYLPQATEKLKALSAYIREHGLDCALEIDGGINAETIVPARDAGANVIVAGTYVFAAADMEAAIETLRG